MTVCLPLALAGLVAAHQASYFAVAGGHHAEALAESGHGYLAQMPLALAILGVLAIVGLAVEGVRTVRGRSRATMAAWPFAVAGPAAFIIQEHLERFLHQGHVPWTAAIEPTFILGLILQMPAALLALGLARLLLRAARQIAAAVHRAFADYQPFTPSGQRHTPLPADTPRRHGPALLAVAPGRAPPVPTPC